MPDYVTVFVVAGIRPSRRVPTLTVPTTHSGMSTCGDGQKISYTTRPDAARAARPSPTTPAAPAAADDSQASRGGCRVVVEKVGPGSLVASAGEANLSGLAVSNRTQSDQKQERSDLIPPD